MLGLHGTEYVDALRSEQSDAPLALAESEDVLVDIQDLANLCIGIEHFSDEFA